MGSSSVVLRTTSVVNLECIPGNCFNNLSCVVWYEKRKSFFAFQLVLAGPTLWCAAIFFEGRVVKESLREQIFGASKHEWRFITVPVHICSHKY